MTARAVALLALATVGALAYDPAALAAEPKAVILLGGAIVVGALGATRLLPIAATVPVLVWCVLGVWWGGAALGAAGIALAACALPRDERLELARAACLVVGGGAGTIALMSWLAGARGMWLHGAMGNPDWLGLLLAVTLVPSIFAGLRRPWVAASVALQLVGWALAGSRTAWLALPVGLAVAMVGARRRVGRGLVAALIAASLTAALLPASSTRHGVSGALAGRLWIWKGSLHAAFHALPFGTGARGFPAAYLIAQGHLLAPLGVADAAHRYVYATTAHNEWLHALAATGIAGALLLAVAVATGIDRVARGFPAGAGATAALAIGATGDVPLHVPAVAIVAALIWATAPRRGLPYPRLVAGALLLACALSIGTQVRDWRVTRTLAHARHALPAARAELLSRAVALAPRSADAEFAWGVDQLERGQLEPALASLDKARTLSETVATDVAIGNALVELKRPAQARDAYRRALALDPGSFRAHANLATALVRLGALDNASHELGLAKRLYPGNPKLGRIRTALEHARLDRASGRP